MVHEARGENREAADCYRKVIVHRQGAPRRLRPRLRGRVRQTRQPARPARRPLSAATSLALDEGPKPETIRKPASNPPGPPSNSGRRVSIGR
jgi:hypothetical protein